MARDVVSVERNILLGGRSGDDFVNWPTAPLGDVAPAEPGNPRFDPDEPVWHLTLDQIESGTGRITNPRTAPASDAGNSTYAFDTDNVLYSKLRPYLNKVVRPSQPGIATTELVPMRPRQTVLLPDFLAYFLRAPEFVSFASAATAGTKMPRIIMSKLWEHHIPLPPLSEQRRIVEILDQADLLRRLRAAADAKADRILPAVFIKTFGDPRTNPHGWNTGPLGDVVLETQYGTSKRASSDGNGVLLLRMNNISAGGRIDLSDTKYVELDDRELERLALRPGDILFNRTNSAELVGKTGLWTRSSPPAVAASYLIRLRVDPAKAVPQYIWALMNTPFMKAALAAKARRAVGMANINATELRRLPGLFPPRHLQAAFATWLDQTDQIEATRTRARESFQRLFGVLLCRAFSGDLTSSWCEARMKELIEEMEQQVKALARG